MATKKQINFFEELKRQGRPSRVETIDDLSVPEAWDIIAKMLGQEGDGSVYQDEDYNNQIIEEYKTAKENNFEDPNAKVSRVESLEQKDTKAGFDIEWLKTNAEENDYSLYTDNPEEAMWITPSGKLLNGNFSDGYRNLDHRNALGNDSAEGIVAAVDAGAVRVIPEYQTIQISNNDIKKLSPQVKKQVEKYIDMGWEVEDVDLRD